MRTESRERGAVLAGAPRTFTSYWQEPLPAPRSQGY